MPLKLFVLEHDGHVRLARLEFVYDSCVRVNMVICLISGLLERRHGWILDPRIRVAVLLQIEIGDSGFAILEHVTCRLKNGQGARPLSDPDGILHGPSASKTQIDARCSRIHPALSRIDISNNRGTSTLAFPAAPVSLRVWRCKDRSTDSPLVVPL